MDLGNTAATPSPSNSVEGFEDSEECLKPLKLFWQKRLGLSEKDLAYGGQGPAPDYMSSLFDLTEAAGERRITSLPWLSQEKTILALKPTTAKKNQEAITFEFEVDRKHLENSFDRAELILPVEYSLAHGLYTHTWICSTQNGCSFVHPQRRDLVIYSWYAYNVTSLMTWKTLPGTQRFTVAINNSKGHHRETLDIRHGKNEPLLVLYTDFPGDRRLSSVFKQYKEYLLSQENDPDEDVSINPVRMKRDIAKKSSSEESLCELHEWSVSVVELGWNQSILRPAAFDANYCAGRCPDDLDEVEVNHTNHAYIKNVYRNRHHNSTLPPAFCVPIRLETVSFLFQANGATSVRSFVEIKARACGCV
jgi:hypothetical protein